MSQSLGEALPEAIAKVSEWIGQQEQQAKEFDELSPGMGDGTRMMARVVRVKRDMALAAQQSGDVIAMIAAYQDLKPCLDLQRQSEPRKATIMSLEAFTDKDAQSELDIREKRIAELERRVRDWQVWYDGVVADFVGLTTNPSDPQKLHDWEWMDDYRPAPLLMQFDMVD